jgi:hypothetical protein
MRSTSSLVQRLARDFPRLSFTTTAKPSYWSSTHQTVFYNPSEPHADWVLLHETAHAILAHDSYPRDIVLLQIERDAWHYAQTVLAKRYDIAIDNEFAESQLDTYRDWLHTKSACPACDMTGVETSAQHYTCLMCGHGWQVNVGIDVAIRRYSQSTLHLSHPV